LEVSIQGRAWAARISHYRDKQNIYKQGEPAYTLFYIQEGGVRLTTKTNINRRRLRRSWGCMIFLASFAWQAIPSDVHGGGVNRQLHTHHQKEKMLQMLRKKPTRPIPWWRTCCPASSTIGITWRTC